MSTDPPLTVGSRIPGAAGPCRLAAREEERATELAGGDARPGADVVGVVPSHQADLEADAGPLDRREHRVRLGKVERERLLAQDVPTGRRCGLPRH
jgi:hypothetical protein